ncbi:hypothetical protein D3C71_2030000 [compost metagenome]
MASTWAGVRVAAVACASVAALTRAVLSLMTSLPRYGVMADSVGVTSPCTDAGL